MMKREWGSLGILIAGLMLAGQSRVGAQHTECLPDLMCLTRTTEHQTVIFRVRNHNPGTITVRFEVNGENIDAPVQFPYVHSFKAGEQSTVFVLRPRDRTEPMKYRYSYRVLFGGLDARHDDEVAYTLPYAPGTAHRVIQGYNGSFSHQDKYAIDWGMPEGTTVYAARAGQVVALCDSLMKGGVDNNLLERANHVLVIQDDGTVAVYAHLQPESVQVEVGDFVRRGDPLARSGNTGYSNAPHLHFEVYRVTSDFDLQTIPVRFDVENDTPIGLKRGRTYRAVFW